MIKMRNCNGSYLFAFDGEYFLYDFNCNVILQIEKKTYEAINKHQNKLMLTSDEEDIVQSLSECGILQPYYIGDHEAISKSDIAYLTFAPTYKCNLRCTYCFGNHGEKYNNANRTFTKVSLAEMLDYFFMTLFPHAKQYRIDFVSGGEPLMGIEIIKAAISYVEQYINQTGKRVSIWLCTNGTLLTNDIIEYLSEKNVSIGISIDGRKEYNDITRIDSNGQGTYDKIVDGINLIYSNKTASKKFKSIWGLCAATNDNCDFVDILKHMNSLGMRNVQIRLVRSTDHYDEKKITQEYKKLFNFLWDNFCTENIDYLRMILNDNDQFGKVLKRIILDQVLTHRCQAGINKITICPDGSIYPCDSFVGIPEFVIGSIESGINRKDYFKNYSVKTIIPCSNCNIKWLCGGDCYYNSFMKNRSIAIPDKEFCAIQKQIIDLSIVLRYKMQITNEQLFTKLYMELKKKNEYSEIFG